MRDYPQDTQKSNTAFDGIRNEWAFNEINKLIWPSSLGIGQLNRVCSLTLLFCFVMGFPVVPESIRG